MRDSNMTDEWIKAQWAKNPCVKLSNGDIRTGPVRLSFANILKPGKPTKQKPDGGFGAVLLFPMGADISVLQNEMRDVALAKWPEAGKPGGPKLFRPIRDQDIDGKGQPGEADRYAGYEKGAMRIGANANQKVPCVDYPRMAPIVEDAKVYSGVWAIVTVRCYTFEQEGNKGPTFGLQAVMIVADDTNLGGTGSANPQEAFAGVTVEAGDINPDAAFGAGEKATTAAIDPFA